MWTCKKKNGLNLNFNYFFFFFQPGLYKAKTQSIVMTNVQISQHFVSFRKQKSLCKGTIRGSWTIKRVAVWVQCLDSVSAALSVCLGSLGGVWSLFGTWDKSQRESWIVVGPQLQWPLEDISVPYLVKDKTRSTFACNLLVDMEKDYKTADCLHTRENGFTIA